MSRRQRPRPLPALLLVLLLLPTVSAGDSPSPPWAAGREVRVATAPSLRPLPPALADTAPLPTLAHGYATLVARHSQLRFTEHPYPSTDASVAAVCQGQADLVLVIGAVRPLHQPCAGLVASAPFRGGKTVLAGRSGGRLPHDVAQLDGRTLAVVNGGPYAEWLQVHHPELHLLHLPDRHATLVAVETGVADVAIGLESTLQPMIRRHFGGTLQLQPFESAFSTDLYLIVRSIDRQLLARIDQALHDITLEEHAGLLQLWARQALPASIQRMFDQMRMPPPHWLLALTALLAGLPILWHVAARRTKRERRRDARAAGMVSHEMRNSAQAMLMSIDLLGRSPLANGQRELLAAATAAGRSLRSLLNRSLDFSRLAGGSFRPRAGACNVASLCRQSLDAIRPQARLKGLQLRFDCTPDPVPVVALDAEALRQIVDNLLGNAVKFTDVGGIELRVQLAPPIEPRALVLDVIDSGIGIDTRHIGHLFRAFQQGEGGQMRGGSGLGLSIARELARAMRGDLTVHSVVGRGSRFTLCLPVQPAGSDVVVPDEAALGCPLAGLDLLLVEDHPLNRQIIAEQLRRLGASVHAVADAADALAEQSRAPRPVVLMDIGLQGMDGYTLARQLRGQARGPLRLVALSARTGRRHVARSRKAGFDAMLTKPLQVTPLLQALQLTPITGDASPNPVAALGPAHLADIHGELTGIERALADRDARAMRHHAHRLQGTLQICGAADQAEIAADLWELGHDTAPDWIDARRLLQVLWHWHGSRTAETMPAN